MMIRDCPASPFGGDEGEAGCLIRAMGAGPSYKNARAETVFPENLS